MYIYITFTLVVCYKKKLSNRVTKNNIIQEKD